MHSLLSIQTIFHGPDSILYFQWRKSRGSAEKFHGTALDNDNNMDNRVFKEVCQIGSVLEDLQPIVNALKIQKLLLFLNRKLCGRLII